MKDHTIGIIVIVLIGIPFAVIGVNFGKFVGISLARMKMRKQNKNKEFYFNYQKGK